MLIRSDSKEANNPTSLKTLEVDIGPHKTKTLSDPSILINTASNPDPSYISSFQSCSSVLSQPKPITCDNPSRDTTDTTPLQTILDTLFGQRKQNLDATNCEINFATDKVQQIQQTCKKANTLELCDDRPYDPEEYDPALTYGVLKSNSPTTVAEDDDRPYDPEEEYNAVDKGDFAKNVPKATEATNTQESSTVNSDVAYDPEDETVFEEIQNYLAGNAITPQKFNICEQDNILNSTLSEQQKILEELNRQIEEQKRQLEEQTETLRLQKEAIGLSMAHFSVSHALMSPPPNFGRDEEEEIERLPYLSTVNEIRDPLTCRKTSRDAEDAPEVPENENAKQILSNMKENQTAVASLFSNKEKLENDKTLPSEGSADTLQLQNTTRSRSEHCSKMESGRRPSRKRSHERSSDHHDRASSRASYKSRVPKDASDRHHRSRHSTKHPSSRSDSEIKRLTSRTSHHDHRDSSSSSRYKRRSDSSTRSHSSWRDRSSQDDSDRSHKTDQKQPSVHSSQSSQPVCKQPPIQQGSNAKADANESSQKLHTTQNPGQESLNNNRNCSEINSKFDHSSKEGLLPMPYMQNVKTAHSYADQPVNSITPTLQPPQIQAGVPYHDKREPSNQLSRNQPAHFLGSNHTAQRRGSLQNDADRLSGAGDYPQRAFQMQFRDFPQSNNSELNCRDIPPQDLPQNKTRDFPAIEAECSSQLQMSRKQKGFTFGERGQFDKLMLSNHTDQTDHQWNQEHRPPQLRGRRGEEPEINQFRHKKSQSYVKGQHFESFQFQQRGSILGPPPVDVGTLRKPKPLNLSCFDKCKPSTEPVMERRKFGQPTNSNTSTFALSKTIGEGVQPGGPSPRSSMFQDGTDTHSGSHHIIRDVMGPISSGAPSEGQYHNPQISHCKSPKRNAPFRQFTNEHNKGGRFLEGHSNNRGFLHHRPNKSRGRPSPHDAYESQSAFSLKTFGEDAEVCRTQTCLIQRSEPYPQDSTCEASPSLFEGQLCPEKKGQPRGPQQSGFRGQNEEKCFARSHNHNMNAQMRGPHFDSPQPFMDQRAPSPDFHGERRPSRNCDSFEAHDGSQSSGFPNTTNSQFKRPEHQNACESQNLRQPFESPSGQTNIRPLRLSGPLLPTPVGCRSRPNIPRLQRPYNESSRSQGPASMRHRPVTHDISGLWVHEEGHNNNPHQSDTSESLVQEERRVEFGGRRGQQIMDSNYGQPCRGPRGTNSSRRAGQRRRFGNISHMERDYSI